MSGLKKYFDTVTYKPTYFLGDRVYGHHEGIPFTGSVYIDSKVYVDSPPRVMVHLYLPIKINGEWVSIITTSHDKIKPLVALEEVKKKKKNVRTTMAE